MLASQSRPQMRVTIKNPELRENLFLRYLSPQLWWNRMASVLDFHLAFILIPAVSITMFGDFNYLSTTDLDEILWAHVLGHGFLFSTFSCQILETVWAEGFWGQRDGSPQFHTLLSHVLLFGSDECDRPMVKYLIHRLPRMLLCIQTSPILYMIADEWNLAWIRSSSCQTFYANIEFLWFLCAHVFPHVDEHLGRLSWSDVQAEPLNT